MYTPRFNAHQCMYVFEDIWQHLMAGWT